MLIDAFETSASKRFVGSIFPSELTELDIRIAMLMVMQKRAILVNAVSTIYRGSIARSLINH